MGAMRKWLKTSPLNIYIKVGYFSIACLPNAAVAIIIAVLIDIETQYQQVRLLLPPRVSAIR
jgi:hypothetical protein